MELKTYVLLAEWGLSDGCLLGLFPRIVERSTCVASCPNKYCLTYANCVDEAIENFVKLGKIKRRKKSVSVNINGKDEPSFYQFTDSIKFLAR